MKRRNFLLLLFMVFIIVIFAYFPILNGFFQQDEWASFSQFFVYKSIPIKELLYFIFTPSVMHFSPLTVLLNFISFYLFGLNYKAYALFSLFGHVLTTYLVFYFSKKLLKSTKLALFSALLFGVLITSHQATAWMATSIPTQWATIFGILSTIIFFNSINKSNTKGLYFSILLLFVSLLFKETTIGLFILFPIALMLFNKTDKNKWIHIRIIIISTLVYVILRGSMLLLPRQVGNSTVFEFQSIPEIIYNFTTVPIKAISQSILPGKQIQFITEKIVTLFHTQITKQKNPFEYEVLLTKNIMETVSLIFSVNFILLSIYVYIKNKRNYLSKIMIFSLTWIVVNSFIFAFAPGVSGIISTIDSRYFYFVSVGTVLYIVSFTYLLLKKTRIIFIVLILLTILNIFWLEGQLSIYAKEGIERRKILDTIKQNYPQLPKNTVLYTQSSQPYYGLPEEIKILPFQSGFGQTLLVWYYPTEKFPTEFFEDRFLWEIDSQGYREVGDIGFGYFRDLDLLIETVKQYNLPEESIIAFSWNGNRNILKDISEDIRAKVHD